MKLTMVIADDELVVLKSESVFLKKYFPDIEIVGLAENGIQLKQMLEEKKPDMAIVDIRMPGLSGIEVIEFLQHKKCSTHFVISTAYSDFEYVKKALDLRTDGYLLKPSKMDEKLELINRMCRTIEREKKEKTRQNSLESAIGRVNSVLGREILMSIFSESLDEEGFEDYCSLNNIRFCGGCIATLLPKSKIEISKRKVNEILEKCLHGLCDFLSTVTSRGVVIMFFVPEELEKTKELKWCEELTVRAAKCVETEMQVECLYSTGKVYRSFSEMADSYEDSVEALKESRKTLYDFVSKENPDKIFSYVERAKQYVEMNYVKDISLMDCAKHVGISPYYLSHIFKERTGQTFIEFLSKVRIEKAKRLCCDTRLTINEISEQCGYLNITYFCRVFKRLTGKTIGEYRKTEKGGYKDVTDK